MDKQVGSFHFWPMVGGARKHARDGHTGNRGNREGGDGQIEGTGCLV